MKVKSTFEFPRTEGIKYAGSKLKLLPYILRFTQKVQPESVFDGFAGTTRVSQAFAQIGYQVISNDIKASSVFEDFRQNENGNFTATKAIEKLLSKTNAKHIILSYSSSGRATKAELFDILEKSGKIIDFVRVDYRQNVMASMRWTND